MLWADDDSSLPNNYFSALVQLKSLERRLEKSPERKASYSQTIEDNLDKEYIFQVEDSDCFRVDNPREWYLLHHQCFTLTSQEKYAVYSMVQRYFMVFH